MADHALPRQLREIGPVRFFFASMAARCLGWGDGLFGKIDRVGHELEKFRQRGEASARTSARWWADMDGKLMSEYCALLERARGAGAAEQELRLEVESARAAHDGSPTSHTEIAFHERERALDRVQRQQADLRERAVRVRAQRTAAFETAKNAAAQSKDYYEALMRTYCAANRKAPTLEHLPTIELPTALQVASLDWTCDDSAQSTADRGAA